MKSLARSTTSLCLLCVFESNGVSSQVNCISVSVMCLRAMESLARSAASLCLLCVFESNGVSNQVNCISVSVMCV